MRKIIDTEKAPKAIGPYSQAVENNNTLYVSGQIPVDPSSGKIVGNDIASQTEQVMKNLKNIIESAGYSMNYVVKCTCFLADLDHFKAFNAVYAQYFKEAPPARATLQVAALPMGALVEVDAIAAME